MVVKCHALRTHLLPKSMLNSMTMAEDLRSIIDALLTTEYGADISKLAKADAHALENVFNKKLVERYDILIKFAPEKMWGLLRAFSRRLDLQNLLRIFRGKFSKLPNERIQETLFPLAGFSDIDFDSFLKAESLDKAVESLKGTLYGRAVDTLGLVRELNNLLPLEFRLWGIHYGDLLSLLARVPGGEREYARRIIGTEIDATNCLICVASTAYGFDKEFVKRLLIPYSYRISSESFRVAAQTDSPDAVRNLLQPYVRIVNHVLNRDDDLAQVELLRYLQEEAEREVSRDSNYSYVLAYMLLCETECRDLSMIALAKQYRLKQEALRRGLISLR